MSLPLSQVIRVNDQIEPTGVLRRDFGIGLLITDSSVLGGGSNQMRVYADSGSLIKDFTQGTEVYKAGQAWFAQSPRPKNLVVGRWIHNDLAAVLTGGTMTKTPAEFAALTNTGHIGISVNGTSYADLTIDFTGVTDYAGVATAIQTAITTAGGTVTVTFNAVTTSLTITTTNTGVAATLTHVAAGTTGLDIGSDIKLNTETAVSLNNGVDAETITQSFEAIKALNDSFYFVMMDKNVASDANILTMSDFLQTQRYMMSSLITDPTVLTPGESTSLAHQLWVKQNSRTWMTYSKDHEYKDVSIAARFSSVNFNSANSIITGKFEQLPTLSPDAVTVTQKDELERKRVNYYTKFAEKDAYSEGTTFSDSAYIDVRYALDWFVNAVQVDEFDLLYASGRIPQTDAGETALINVLNNVCRQAITNGMIAGGTVSEAMKADIIATTGNNDFDGTLPNGYLLWSQPTAAQPQAEREARKATAKKGFLKSGGAIHSAEFGLTLEN